MRYELPFPVNGSVSQQNVKTLVGARARPMDVSNAAFSKLFAQCTTSTCSSASRARQALSNSRALPKGVKKPAFCCVFAIQYAKNAIFVAKTGLFSVFLGKCDFCITCMKKRQKITFCNTVFTQERAPVCLLFGCAPHCAKLTKSPLLNFKHLYKIETVRAQKRAFREKTLAKKAYL